MLSALEFFLAPNPTTKHLVFKNSERLNEFVDGQWLTSNYNPCVIVVHDFQRLLTVLGFFDVIAADNV